MTYLSYQEANKLITHALKQKTPLKRIQETSKIFKIAHQIAFDQRLKWIDLIEQLLRDSLITGKFDEALMRLKDSFSAVDSKRLMDLAVVIFLKVNDLNSALEWIEVVLYVYGVKAIKHLVKNNDFKALHKSKRFLMLLGPKAKITMIKDHLKESVRMWKNDEYDNIKDALEMSKSILMEVPKSERALLEVAKKHYEEVLKETRRLIKEEPDLKNYLKGLL